MPGGPVGWNDLPAADVARDVAERLGQPGRVVVEVARQHVESLVAAVQLDTPDLLVDQVAWERSRLRDQAVDPEELHGAVAAALADRVGEEQAARAADLLERARAAEPPPTPEVSDDLPADAAAYLAAGLAGRRHEAVAVVRARMARGQSTWQVTSEVLIPAQREVGRLWESGQVTIPQEHHLTAITASCLALLQGRGRREAAADAPRMLASAVAEEAHDLGLRVLVEMMSQSGWDTEYVGAGVPTADLVTHVARTRPDVLALSVTLVGHAAAVRDLVTRLRAHPGCDAVKVLLGGRAINQRPELVEAIGGDGWAADAAAAVELCRQWTEPRAEPDAETGPHDPDEQDRSLAARYRFEQRHMAQAVELLAEHSDLSVEEVRALLRGLPQV